jgi:hypothetical protein
MQNTPFGIGTDGQLIDRQPAHKAALRAGL